jgi:hypothetical protein
LSSGLDSPSVNASTQVTKASMPSVSMAIFQRVSCL